MARAGGRMSLFSVCRTLAGLIRRAVLLKLAPGDVAIMCVQDDGDLGPGLRMALAQLSTHTGVTVVVLPEGASLAEASEDAMRSAGWVRADAVQHIGIGPRHPVRRPPRPKPRETFDGGSE